MVKTSTFYIKKLRDNILVASLYQLSPVIMTFFLAKAEVKTEGEKVKKEKQEARVGARHIKLPQKVSHSCL